MLREGLALTALVLLLLRNGICSKMIFSKSVFCTKKKLLIPVYKRVVDEIFASGGKKRGVVTVAATVRKLWR